MFGLSKVTQTVIPLINKLVWSVFCFFSTVLKKKKEKVKSWFEVKSFINVLPPLSIEEQLLFYYSHVFVIASNDVFQRCNTLRGWSSGEPNTGTSQIGYVSLDHVTGQPMVVPPASLSASVIT